MHRGHAALGTFLYPEQDALCTFLDQGLSALDTFLYHPYLLILTEGFDQGLLQDSTSGLTTLGPKMYTGLPALKYRLVLRAYSPGYIFCTQGSMPYVHFWTKG